MNKEDIEKWLPYFGTSVHNTERIEKIIMYLWNMCGQHEENMRYLIYEFRCVLDMECRHDFDKMAPILREKKLAWGHSVFDTIRNQTQEMDDFLENPPEIEEGILECRRCHSRRTFSFSKQTRRSDEAATVFVQCSQCQYSFRL